MQLTHSGGWRLSLIPHADGKDSCYRLCRDRVWAGDCPVSQLTDLLAGHGLVFDDFTAAHIDCCVMVDPSTHVACLRPAEPVDGHNHLPLCGMCRQTPTRMYDFPCPRDLQTPAAVLPHLSNLWRNVGDQHRQELAHHLRHPVAKILGWAEILHDDALPAVHTRQLQVIYQSAQELQRLLNQAASPL